MHVIRQASVRIYCFCWLQPWACRYAGAGSHIVYADQLLSKEAQRLITELRRKGADACWRLSLNYYDANKTGALVSRIYE